MPVDKYPSIFLHQMKAIVYVCGKSSNCWLMNCKYRTKLCGSNEPKQGPIKALIPHREPKGNQK